MSIEKQKKKSISIMAHINQAVDLTALSYHKVALLVTDCILSIVDSLCTLFT